jgi:amino-acid N-acetyltransferase
MSALKFAQGIRLATTPKSDAFVTWFRQVAPYIHAFRGRTFVIAFGGEAVAERGRFAQFVHDVNLLAALGIRLVLVHGARPQIEAQLKGRKLRSRFVRGLRVTDAESLAAVKQAAGVLRVELEAMLSQGLPNSPMAGAQIRVASGNYITARPLGVLDGVDFQFTGQVRRVDAQAISRRLDAGEVVLVPHIGYSPTGEVFNLAWEDVAENVAVAVKADKLLMFCERLPAGADGGLLAELTAKEALALAKRATGLPPPTARALEHVSRAVISGVRRAHLLPRRVLGATLLELFTHSGIGSMITADPVEQLRPAGVEDVGGILALIEPLEADGTLVKRNRDLLESEITNFHVIEHDGVIVGCAALYRFAADRSGELACLAVAEGYRDSGYGERLLKVCEEQAKKHRLKRLFALTTRAAHWFLSQGFKPGDVSALPSDRQQLYNWKRGSKVFLKRL